MLSNWLFKSWAAVARLVSKQIVIVILFMTRIYTRPAMPDQDNLPTPRSALQTRNGFVRFGVILKYEGQNFIISALVYAVLLVAEYILGKTCYPSAVSAWPLLESKRLPAMDGYCIDSLSYAVKVLSKPEIKRHTADHYITNGYTLSPA